MRRAFSVSELFTQAWDFSAAEKEEAHGASRGELRDLCRKHGFSDASLYKQRAEYKRHRAAYWKAFLRSARSMAGQCHGLLSRALAGYALNFSGEYPVRRRGKAYLFPRGFDLPVMPPGQPMTGGYDGSCTNSQLMETAWIIRKHRSPTVGRAFLSSSCLHSRRGLGERRQHMQWPGSCKWVPTQPQAAPFSP